MKVLNGTKNGIKRVLVVDDDEGIRNLCEEVLTVAGYVVETSHNGLNALAKVKESEFDAVLSDLNMPGAGGIDLYINTLRERPHMKERFLFMSGNCNDDVRSFLEQLELKCLLKPFRVTELLTGVDSVASKAPEKGPASMKKTGKRQESRFSLASGCEIFGEGQSRSRHMKANTENVSRGGIKVTYDGTPLAQGTPVSVYISLNELSLQREAQVVWSAPEGSRRSAAGLKFMEPLPVTSIVNVIPVRAGRLGSQP